MTVLHNNKFAKRFMEIQTNLGNGSFLFFSGFFFFFFFAEICNNNKVKGVSLSVVSDSS